MEPELDNTDAVDEPGKPDMRLFPLIPLDMVAMTGTHWLERARVELRVLVQVAATSGRSPAGDSVRANTPPSDTQAE